MKRLGLILASAMTMAGCVSGPDYRRSPDAVINRDAANGQFVGAGNTAFVAAPAVQAWWRLYDDPTLDGLIEDAILANTDLRVASANIERAQAGLDLAKADTRPTTVLQAASGFSKLSAEQELIPGGRALPGKFVYGAGASVSYLLDWSGKIDRAIETEQANVAAAQAIRDAVTIAVVAETTRAYVDACSAGHEIEVATSLLALQHRATELTRLLYKAGRSISLDVTRATSVEDQVQATIAPLQARKSLALYRLALLTARVPAQVPVAAGECVQSPTTGQPIPVGDGAALLQRRPDVRRAEFELRAANARIGVATADLYPKIVLGASIDSVGLLGNFLNRDTLKLSILPGISWEFPERKRVKARLRGTRAEQQAAAARFDGVVLNALREVEEALVVYARDIDRRRVLAEAKSQAEIAARDSERLFKLGRLTAFPVLDANRTLVSSEQAVAAADTKLALDQISIFLALGGGWESCCSNEQRP
jgi:NodT family efflux transporter outer membrane factor (OMF) lipoprotein